MADHDFSGVLRQRRLEKELTIESLAFRSGLSVATVSRAERRGGHVPTQRTLMRLAKALEMNPVDLFVQPADSPA